MQFFGNQNDGIILCGFPKKTAKREAVWRILERNNRNVKLYSPL